MQFIFSPVVFFFLYTLQCLAIYDKVDSYKSTFVDLVLQGGAGPSPRGKKGPSHTPKQHRDKGIDFYFSRSKNLWDVLLQRMDGPSI